MTNTARALNLAGWAFGLITGLAGVFLMLAALAGPVAAADNPAGGCRLTAPGALFNPCADLDVSRVSDDRGDDLRLGA